MSSPVAVQMWRGPVVDTEQRKAVVRRLTDALYEYLTLDVAEMERGAAMAPPTSVKIYTPEMLVQATDDAAVLRDSIEKARAGLDSVPDGMRGLFEAGTIVPLEQQLHQMERYIQVVQKELEAA